MKFKTTILDWLNYAMLLILVVVIVVGVIYSNGKYNESIEDPSKPYRNDTIAVDETAVPEVNISSQVLSTVKDRRSARTMQLYDSNGERVSGCSALKGKFDGHTWYVFYDNLAVPAVVHDPLCACGK